MSSFFGILSFVLSVGATVPYIFDVVKGRARLARSTRILFLLLMVTTLVVQSREFTSWVLMLTAAEVATQVVLFILCIRHGIGGWSRLDLYCYAAFAVGLSAYLITKNAAVSLTLLVLTDFIAFVPTIVKNWRDPTTDTWIFFVVGGMAAAAASLLSRGSNDYAEIVFPAYTFSANALAVAPILLHRRRTRRRLLR